MPLNKKAIPDSPRERDLRVWHVSNPPSPGLRVPVNDPEEAWKILTALAEYDLSLEDLIFANVQGMEVFEDGEWSEWYDDDGRNIEEWVEWRETHCHCGGELFSSQTTECSGCVLIVEALNTLEKYVNEVLDLVEGEGGDLKPALLLIGVVRRGFRRAWAQQDRWAKPPS